MLRSEISELENLVAAILARETSPVDAGYDGAVSAIRVACSALRKKWTQELLGNAREQVIKRYVQYHQAGLTGLSDRVSGKSTSAGLPEAFSSPYSGALELVNAELNAVLGFLQQQCYAYFDKDHPATVYHCRMIIAEYQALATAVADAANAIDPLLIAAVLSSVKDNLSEGLVSGISYRRAEQCSNLILLMQRAIAPATKMTEQELIRTLYQQNLNSRYFFHWYAGQISAVLRRTGTLKEKDHYIQELILTLGDLYVSPDKALVPELPGIDTAMLDWLTDQATAGRPKIVKAPVQQFPLNLSVPQFALFIRIFYKTGCLPVDNVAMITRFFTTHFTTKKQAHVSPKSFGRAFYNIDQPAAAVVRDLLQKMLNYLHKTYFP